MSSLKEMLDQFIADGVLTRDEHDEFIEAVHADGKIDDEEKAQIEALQAEVKTLSERLAKAPAPRVSAPTRPSTPTRPMVKPKPAPTPTRRR